MKSGTVQYRQTAAGEEGMETAGEWKVTDDGIMSDAANGFTVFCIRS